MEGVEEGARWTLCATAGARSARSAKRKVRQQTRPVMRDGLGQTGIHSPSCHRLVLSIFRVALSCFVLCGVCAVQQYKLHLEVADEYHIEGSRLTGYETGIKETSIRHANPIWHQPHFILAAGSCTFLARRVLMIPSLASHDGLKFPVAYGNLHHQRLPGSTWRYVHAHCCQHDSKRLVAIFQAGDLLVTQAPRVHDLGGI